MICVHLKQRIIYLQVHIIILMIADTHTEVVINTGILNIEVEI